MTQQSSSVRPHRRMDYGELPPDAEFLEVPPSEFRVGRAFARLGLTPKPLAEATGLTADQIEMALIRTNRRAGCENRAELLSALRTKRIVLVPVHDHRAANLLTRVSER